MEFRYCIQAVFELLIDLFLGIYVLNNFIEDGFQLMEALLGYLDFFAESQSFLSY